MSESVDNELSEQPDCASSPEAAVGTGHSNPVSSEAETMGLSTLLEELHMQDENALRDEFMRLQDERDSYEEQYRVLLSKVSQMRTTLGERLQQDAVRAKPLTSRKS